MAIGPLPPNNTSTVNASDANGTQPPSFWQALAHLREALGGGEAIARLQSAIDALKSGQGGHADNPPAAQRAYLPDQSNGPDPTAIKQAELTRLIQQSSNGTDPLSTSWLGHAVNGLRTLLTPHTEPPGRSQVDPNGLAVDFGRLSKDVDVTSPGGKQAIDTFSGDLGMLRGRIAGSREIPPDAKALMLGQIDAANNGLSDAISEAGPGGTKITDQERTGLIDRAVKLGMEADGIVAAQNASPNAPVPPETYRQIITK